MIRPCFLIGCFTRAQRAAIEVVYAPPTRPDGTVILPGQPFGGEGHAQGWRSWITGPNESLLRATSGQAPERIVAAKSAEDGTVLRTRPLCPYPERAVYTGSGSTDAAEHFACRAP